MFLQKFMGQVTIDNHAFYKQILVLGAPVALQNFFQALVNMLDVFMIGQLGAAEVTAVAMGSGWIGLLFYLFNGITATGGVFISQYWGKKDTRSIHHYMGLMFILNLTFSIIFAIFTALFSDTIMLLYSKDPEVIALGSSNMKIMSISCVLIGLINVCSISLVSTEKTFITMLGTIISLSTNTIFNYILIFGNFGAPKLGVRGAAIGTIIALTLELLFLYGVSIIKKFPICAPIKEYFQFSFSDVKKYFHYGTFLIMCEVVFAIGNNIYNIGYKYTGTASQAALQIVNTFTQLAMILSQGIGTAAGIMLGKLLGENKLELVKAYSRRFMVLIPAVAFVLGVIIALFSPLLLSMFNVGEESLGYAQKMMVIFALTMPFRAENFAIVAGILRSGGDSLYCFLANFVGNWLVGIPMVFLGTVGLHLPVYWVYLMVSADELGKMVVGMPRALYYKWVKNIT